MMLIIRILLLFNTELVIDSADISVYDGDTFYAPILFLESHPVRIRGIDTPEKGFNSKCEMEHKLAILAQEHLLSVLQHNTITLTNLKLDKYKRLLATVSIDGIDVARNMLATNHARPYKGGKRQSWCDPKTI